MVVTFITGNLKDCPINSIKTSEWNLTPYLSCYNINKIRVGFDRVCLKQDQGIIRLKGIVNIYVVNEIINNFNISDYPTLEHFFWSYRMNQIH